MLGSLFSKFGGAIGNGLGGGILSTIGRYGGKMLGDHLEDKALHRTESSYKFTNIKDGFRITKASYGSPIPLIFGRTRVTGQIIWISNVREQRNTSTTRSHFKSKHLTLEKNTISLEYYANFAIALCEGEISEIGRVWYNDQVINLGKYNFRLYKGDEKQLPDPLISNLSDEPSPGYRGLAYIVFERLPLADFGDTIPNLSFEVTRKSNAKQDSSVEDLVKSIVIIPGSGEYVYDTKIQKKSTILPSGAVLSTTTINSHNHFNIANSVHSLNQLQTTCENIEWVAPVVCWFGNNIDAKHCTIRPAIEFNDPKVSYSEEWSVGGYNRSNAYEISKDELQNPLYGGSVNDASVIRYLEEIKSRNLKVMFYPMFFLDTAQKPWRGHVTTDPENIRNFFRKNEGYNKFILHYAHLVKNHIDAFVIGSELIGLTKVRDGTTFPAVNELIELARQVKEIVGENVQVTYAADWSEYHHTTGGWYNLDPLWACPYIDFIGIDAYFPVTKSMSSAITPEELAEGWISGEGYDYYVDYANNTQHQLQPEYAWKNIRFWWENTHTNPDGSLTPWQPRSKPIWFTEFGFPSIDKASNQPNVFFDPKCLDGGSPRHSNGTIDFSIQRKAIRAFLEYWKTQEYIGGDVSMDLGCEALPRMASYEFLERWKSMGKRSLGKQQIRGK
ncbi:MAG: glycoside hydrolase TIM-barrel-like domain-containing protein [Rickettsiaceae bacterium]|nr:glycoside hydrolase TIM-barrel-like domain-containing protein [Rickettsiaceae bacterium]